MPSHTCSRTRLLSTLLVMLFAGQLPAFEQGTYFIYQLTDNSDTKVVKAHLPLDRALFNPVKAPETQTVTSTQERSEFEMDYNTLGTTNNAGFESTRSQPTNTQISTSSSLFDINTSEASSLFGD